MLLSEDHRAVQDAVRTFVQERIAPHADAMRARMAELLGIEPARVAVKATTMERMGFVGRGEGIAALATATVALPGEGG